MRFLGAGGIQIPLTPGPDVIALWSGGIIKGPDLKGMVGHIITNSFHPVYLLAIYPEEMSEYIDHHRALEIPRFPGPERPVLESKRKNKNVMRRMEPASGR